MSTATAKKNSKKTKNVEPKFDELVANESLNQIDYEIKNKINNLIRKYKLSCSVENFMLSMLKNDDFEKEVLNNYIDEPFLKQYLSTERYGLFEQYLRIPKRPYPFAIKMLDESIEKYKKWLETTTYLLQFQCPSGYPSGLFRSLCCNPFFHFTEMKQYEEYFNWEILSEYHMFTFGELIVYKDKIVWKTFLSKNIYAYLPFREDENLITKMINYIQFSELLKNKTFMKNVGSIIYNNQTYKNFAYIESKGSFWNNLKFKIKMALRLF